MASRAGLDRIETLRNCIQIERVLFSEKAGCSNHRALAGAVWSGEDGYDWHPSGCGPV